MPLKVRGAAKKRQKTGGLKDRQVVLWIRKEKLTRAVNRPSLKMIEISLYETVFIRTEKG